MALSAEQQKKKTERAFKRRADRRKAERDAKRGSAVDVDTGEKYEITVHDNDSKLQKRRAPVVKENLKILRAPAAIDVEEKKLKKRVRYATMQTHMEIAAYALASGATNKQAAEKAGISRRQVRKYMENADFRERIMELQETLGGRIRGRIMKEIDRRTTPEMIKKMELLDVLRVGDRFGLGRGTGNTVINDNREVHNYEATFNALFHGAENSQRLSDSEEEGADFPEFEPTSLALSGGDSPVEG